ncbi:neurotrypsin isoform X2 [Trichomycterus rosablanca]|uniref:neurotrypsin isoform X2 n=1 Tax=Trichomycterus rosablanca TaxID=2290929 RepID=UPI002F35E360
MEAPALSLLLLLLRLLLGAICGCRSSSAAPSFLQPFTGCVQSGGGGGGRGAPYRGSVDVTESGARCMNWSEVSGVIARYPGTGLGQHNWCRNPDGRIRPWCFFRTARGRIDWGYCDCKQGSVRLQGGRSKLDGTVELYVDGVWGTICSHEWDDRDAAVVCRQEFGHGGTAKAWTGAYFGAGTGPVLLDEVSCTGNELSIEQCPKTAWGEHNCDHSEDAGVSCAPLTDGSVRLVGGAGGFEGRLEVHHRGRWGTVCAGGWTSTNTQVVCRQLGYRSGQLVGPQGFGAAPGPAFWNNVSCTGKEPALAHCAKREGPRHDCPHAEDVAVACSAQRTGRIGAPTDVPVRLVGGENAKEGRVEILIAGQWGTICDDGWTDEDAEVVCRQLGHSGPAKARVMAYFGEGLGPIHVDNVRCAGDERSLADCIKQAVGSHNCRHSEDAGVICDYGRRDGRTPVKEAASSACGLRPFNTRRKRIIGGENSQRGGWPWQVAVRLRGSQSDGRLVCGATLINSCWVLTSAHCFKRYGNSTGTYKVRVGDYHTLVPEEHEDEYGVDRIVLHPRYRPHSNDYDLALVRLTRRGGHGGECVRQSGSVLPVCLPGWRERAPKDSSKCYITGWGDTGRSYSKTLQQASVRVLSKRQCRRGYGDQFTGRMICAGSALLGRHADSCRGDSGGPLVCQRAGAWAVYGVTSWGHSCRLRDSPGVYTKVSAFVPWIERVLRR